MDLINRNILAANLRSLRGGTGLSREKVAARAGVKKNLLDNVENGKGNLTYEDAWKLASFYKVSIDELGGRDISRRCTMAEVA